MKIPEIYFSDFKKFIKSKPKTKNLTYLSQQTRIYNIVEDFAQFKKKRKIMKTKFSIKMIVRNFISLLRFLGGERLNRNQPESILLPNIIK